VGKPGTQRHADVSFDVITLFMLTVAFMSSMLVVATGTVSSFAEVSVTLGLATGWVQIVGSIALHQVERLGHAKITKRLRFWILLLVSAPMAAVVVVWFAAY
jgi:hypothetical protein